MTRRPKGDLADRILNKAGPLKGAGSAARKDPELVTAILSAQERAPGLGDLAGKLVSQGRAARVARSLFPDEFSDGSNCMAEEGRKGERCRICDERFATWMHRVREVRAVMIEAFS